jgi:hypothetical protein
LGLDASELGQHLVEYLGTVGRMRASTSR